MLARMHLAGQDYPRQQPNLRSLAWWRQTEPEILPFLDAAQRQLLASEIAHQTAFFGSGDYAALAERPVPLRPLPRQRPVRHRRQRRASSSAVSSISTSPATTNGCSTWP